MNAADFGDYDAAYDEVGSEDDYDYGGEDV